MRRRLAIGGALVLGLWWWLSGSEPAESKLDGVSGARGREINRDFRDLLGGARKGGLRLGTISRELRESGLVQITGSVIDRLSRDRIGDVEVVFRGFGGEETVTAGADGSYRIDLVPGAYRAFVRDDSVLSVGFPIEERLPGFPDLDAIGMPDETAMPLVIAQQDLEEVDLFVVRGGTIHGRVLDGNGRPVAHAVVRAFTSGARLRPALGSDVAETDEDGTYEVRLPAGEWYLEVRHARYAGNHSDIAVSLDAGGNLEVDLTVTAGCVIAGKVLDANGLPAGDGALELEYGGGFAPAGKILADGTFRWSTTEEREVTLRAWPWKAPHSQDLKFACRDGARFDNVVFRLPSRGPDIAGVLVDASGQPVPMAFLDLAPLDDTGIAQQERSGADGSWGVFAMPAGRYQLTGYAPGRGVVSTIVTSPAANVRLQLGGTGKVVGTVTGGLTTGSFELMLSSCSLDGISIKITEDARIVSVREGKFELAGLPACELSGRAKWRDIVRPFYVTVGANGSATVEVWFDINKHEDIEVIPDDDEPDVEPSVY